MTLTSFVTTESLSGFCYPSSRPAAWVEFQVEHRVGSQPPGLVSHLVQKSQHMGQSLYSDLDIVIGRNKKQGVP